MLSLYDLQRRFAAGVLAETDAELCNHIVPNGFTAAERLRIYRNTFYSTLTQTLRIAYPALDRLVGGEFFDAAAERFIRADPPSSAYLNDYGDGFGEFLAELPGTRAWPYLPDVARFEWALSIAANAPDVPALTAEALAAVDPSRHVSLSFEPHPSVRLLALDFPADTIADAVMSGDDDAVAALHVQPMALRVVVHRGPCGVEAQRLGQDEYAFVSRLYRGEPLGHALENAFSGALWVIAEQLTKGRLSAFKSGVHRG
jgi:hypothetical protein